MVTESGTAGIRWLLALPLAVLWASLGAEEELLPGEPPADHHFVPGKEWREGAFQTPEYPRKGNLIEIPVKDPRRQFTYFLDDESLTIGEDAVVRYTVVIRSRTGAENVFFEGIRCMTKEYRTYAIGGSDKNFRPMLSREWLPIVERGSMRYRYGLYESYLCQGYSPLRKKEIISRLKTVDAHLYDESGVWE